MPGCSRTAQQDTLRQQASRRTKAILRAAAHGPLLVQPPLHPGNRRKFACRSGMPYCSHIAERPRMSLTCPACAPCEPSAAPAHPCTRPGSFSNSPDSNCSTRSPIRARLMTRSGLTRHWNRSWAMRHLHAGVAAGVESAAGQLEQERWQQQRLCASPEACSANTVNKPAAQSRIATRRRLLERCCALHGTHGGGPGSVGGEWAAAFAPSMQWAGQCACSPPATHPSVAPPP